MSIRLPAMSPVQWRRLLFLGLWIACALVFSGWVTWRIQSASEYQRKSTLQAWCDRRARSLEQHFLNTHSVVETFVGLQSVFGNDFSYPWLLSECMDQQYLQYAQSAFELMPWLMNLNSVAFVNGSERATFESNQGCSIGLLSTLPGVPVPSDWNAPTIGGYVRGTPENWHCIDVRTSPFGLMQMRSKCHINDSFLTPPYVGKKGFVVIAMSIPVWPPPGTHSPPPTPCSTGAVGAVGATVQFKALADFIKDDNGAYLLEVYDVTREVNLTTSQLIGPRLMYHLNDENTTYDPKTGLIPPASESVLQPWRHKAVAAMRLTDQSRQYEVWCRFSGPDSLPFGSESILLGLLILTVATLLGLAAIFLLLQTDRFQRDTEYLARLKSQAEAEEAAKSRFVADTSHELRTPLHGLIGLLEHIQDTPLSEEQHEHTSTALQQSEQILSVLNRVLDLAKVTSGKLQLEQVEFEVEPWVEESVAAHRRAAQDKGLQVSINVSEDIDPVVRGDPFRLRQLVQHVMDNAVKFTDTGSVSLSLSLVPSNTRIPAFLSSIGCYTSHGDKEEGGGGGERGERKGGVWSGESTRLVATFVARARSVIERTPRTLVFPQKHDARLGQQALSVSGDTNAGGKSGTAWLMQRKKDEASDGCGDFGGLEQHASPSSRDLLQGKHRQLSRRMDEDVQADTCSWNGNEMAMMGADLQLHYAGDPPPACLATSASSPESHRLRCRSWRYIWSGQRSSSAPVDQHGAGVGKGRDEGRQLLLLVRCEDTGCGIAEEDKELVFHAFSRAQRRMHIHGGAGISLYLSQQMARAMGGDIGIKSTEGQGTTAFIVVPIQAVTIAHPSSPEEPHHPSQATTYHPTGRSVHANNSTHCLPLQETPAAGGSARSLGACRPSPRQLLTQASGASFADVAVGGGADVAAGGGGTEEFARIGTVRRALEPLDVQEELGRRLKGRRVLVVDDNLVNRMVAARFFTRYGARVDAVESGEKALEAVAVAQCSDSHAHAVDRVESGNQAGEGSFWGTGSGSVMRGDTVESGEINLKEISPGEITLEEVAPGEMNLKEITPHDITSSEITPGEIILEKLMSHDPATVSAAGSGKHLQLMTGMRGAEGAARREAVDSRTEANNALGLPGPHARPVCASAVVDEQRWVTTAKLHSLHTAAPYAEESNSSSVDARGGLPCTRVGVFHCARSTDGERTFAPAPFDFVFMDLQMPGMDGYEASYRIRQFEDLCALSYNACIVGMTADVDDDVIRECGACKMNGVLGKPVNAAELLDILRYNCDVRDAL